MATSIDLGNLEKEIKKVAVEKLTADAKKEGLKVESKSGTVSVSGDDAKVKKFIDNLSK